MSLFKLLSQSLALRVMSFILAFVLNVLLTRVLPIETLGCYYLFLLLIKNFGLLIKCGMENSLQKTLSLSMLSKKGPLSIFKIAVQTFLLSSVFSLLLLYIFKSSIFENFLQINLSKNLFILVSSAILIHAIEELLSASLRGTGKTRRGVFFLDLPRYSMLCLLILITLHYDFTLNFEKIVFYYSLASLFSCVFSSIALFYGGFKLKISAEGTPESYSHSLISFWKLSVPMLFHGAAAVVMSTGDLWVIGWYENTSQSGLYGAVLRLAGLMLFGLQAINLIFPSKMAQLYLQKEKQQLENLLRSLATLSAFLCIPLWLIYFFYGTDVLNIVFGKDFIVGYNILLILSTAQACNALAGSPGMLLQMSGHHKSIFYATLVWAFVNFGLDIIAIKIAGLSGVATVTGFSIIGLNLTILIMAFKKTGIKTWAGGIHKSNLIENFTKKAF